VRIVQAGVVAATMQHRGATRVWRREVKKEGGSSGYSGERTPSIVDLRLLGHLRSEETRSTLNVKQEKLYREPDPSRGRGISQVHTRDKILSGNRRTKRSMMKRMIKKGE